MGIKALEGLVPAWYTPIGQDDDDKPTRFKLKPLNGDQYAEVMDHFRVEEERLHVKAAGQKICLKHALVDWENFADSSGDVEFLPTNFRLIPYSQRTELVTHIMLKSALSEEQEKN